MRGHISSGLDGGNGGSVAGCWQAAACSVGHQGPLYSWSSRPQAEADGRGKSRNGWFGAMHAVQQPGGIPTGLTPARRACAPPVPLFPPALDLRRTTYQSKVPLEAPNRRIGDLRPCQTGAQDCQLSSGSSIQSRPLGSRLSLANPTLHITVDLNWAPWSPCTCASPSSCWEWEWPLPAALAPSKARSGRMLTLCGA